MRKSKLLPTDLLGDARWRGLRRVLEEEGWGLLDDVEEFVYLGILTGPLVGATDVFKRAEGRAEQRLPLWAARAWGKEAGATGWIVKPFDPEQLLATVRRVLD